MARLREQERARRARAAVDRLLGSNQTEKKKEIVQELKGLPARIQASGLGQTLAFYASKKGHHEAIGNELVKAMPDHPAYKANTILELLDRITGTGKDTGMDAGTYRRATREAVALSEWMKRYATALGSADTE